MSRFDRCESCLQGMPPGNLHCFGCGDDLPPPGARQGEILVQLYPAGTQTDAFAFYRVEAERLAGAGWYPIAHSWGDEPPSAGLAWVFGYVAELVPGGTLLVTYRHGGTA